MTDVRVDLSRKGGGTVCHPHASWQGSSAWLLLSSAQTRDAEFGDRITSHRQGAGTAAVWAERRVGEE
eukprot:2966783-Rhodomonas_salina.1